MKTFRPLLALAAAAVMAALPVADAAAQDRGRWGRDDGGRGRGRGDYQQTQQRRDEPRGQARGRGPDGYGPPGQARRQYAPQPQYAPPEYAPRSRQYDRGGYLPPSSGARVEDPSRYRLREPPRGYGWVRMGDRYMMVDQRTGQIFDVVR
jgi:Ni/Co efflux regulator RcnB